MGLKLIYLLQCFVVLQLSLHSTTFKMERKKSKNESDFKSS